MMQVYVWTMPTVGVSIMREREGERKTIRSIIICQDSGNMICGCNRPKKYIQHHIIVPLGVSALYLTKLYYTIYTYTISIRLREYILIQFLVDGFSSSLSRYYYVRGRYTRKNNHGSLENVIVRVSRHSLPPRESIIYNTGIWLYRRYTHTL